MLLTIIRERILILPYDLSLHVQRLFPRGEKKCKKTDELIVILSVRVLPEEKKENDSSLFTFRVWKC